VAWGTIRNGTVRIRPAHGRLALCLRRVSTRRSAATSSPPVSTVAASSACLSHSMPMKRGQDIEQATDRGAEV
jgi:hypothetical protein